MKDLGFVNETAKVIVRMIILLFSLFLPSSLHAQWEIGIGGGPSISYDKYRYRVIYLCRLMYGSLGFCVWTYNCNKQFVIREEVDWTRQSVKMWNRFHII